MTSEQVLTAAHGEPFVGRARELRELRSSVDKVLAGSPQLVRVEGETGVGKSHLINRLLSTLVDFTVLGASGDPGEVGLPFGTLEQLVSRLHPSRLDRFGALARGVAGPAGGTTPFAAGADFLQLLSSLQSAGPVAVVIDDVQWCDEQSAQALAFALRRLWADQILVLLVTRSPLPPVEAETLSRYLSRHQLDSTTIRLDGLSVPDITELSGLLCADELTPLAALRLHRHTDGNPLHVRALLDEIPVEQLNNASEDGLPVPQSLTVTIAGTLRRLPPESVRMVEALAVLNTRSPLARVAQLADVERPAQALRPALDAQVVRWWPNEPGCPIALRHSLQRDAVYESLAPERRRELHTVAAELVDAFATWAHRVAASATTDPDLADQLEEAATRHADYGQHDLAGRYLGWAADLSGTRAEYERRTLTAVVQSSFTSHPARVSTVRSTIARFAPSPLRDLALGMAELFGAGDGAAAERWLRKAISHAESTGAPAWITSTAAGALSAISLWRGHGEGTVAAADLALRNGGLVPRMADAVRTYRAVGLSREKGLQAGHDSLAHLPARASQAGDDQLECLACRGAVRVMMGRYRDALGDLSVTIHRQRAGADLMSGGAPHSYLVAAQFALGLWDDASVTSEQELSVRATYEQAQVYTLATSVATLVPAARGQWALAERRAQAAVTSALKLGTPQDLRYGAIAEAAIGLARGDYARVVRIMELMRGAGAVSGTHVWWRAWWHPPLVEALIRTGRLAEAAEHLEVLRGEVAEVEHVGDIVSRLRAAVAEERGHRDEAVEILAEQVAAEGPLPFFRAQLHHDYGRLLTATGRRKEAREWLEKARDTFRELSAQPYLRRVADDLAAAGTRPEAAPVDVEQALTDRERQVMHLAGRGMTNREIAQELYVTSKTVEYHLGNIYGKLGITSRRELRRLLGS